MDPGTPFLGPLSLGAGVCNPSMSTDLLGWVPISLPNFHLNAQGTIAAEAPLHLDLPLDAWVRSGSWSDLTRPSIFRGVLWNFYWNTPFRLYGPDDPVFRAPWPQGWGYLVESLAVQSAGGKVVPNLAQGDERCGRLYQVYKQTHTHARLIIQISPI